MSYLKRIFNKEYNVEITPNEEINHLEYSNSSIYSEIEKMIKKYPNNDALCYYGKNISYESFGKLIDKCAKSLKKLGINRGERVTICMPNTPEAIIMFYAVNLIGAVSSMIHPLSSVNEIEYYLDIANSKYILTVDLFEEKVIDAAMAIYEAWKQYSDEENDILAFTGDTPHNTVTTIARRKGEDFESFISKV